MKVLILGANGMLGSSLTRYLSKNKKLSIYACVRNKENASIFKGVSVEDTIENVDVLDDEALSTLFEMVKPAVVINCVGIIKQVELSKSYTTSIGINSLYPHRLASICDKYSSRMIHFSTDCVFSGSKGNYLESDFPDSNDLYGQSKLLGEVTYGNHLTIRTSIIGHENKSPVSLIDWFLGQKEIKGFSKAIFSGLPTVCVAEVLEKYFIFDDSIKGLYNLSVDPIDKYSLLKLVSIKYGHRCEIVKDSNFIINRSLDYSKLSKEVGYKPDNWDTLIQKMHSEYKCYFSTDPGTGDD
ncbi:dTDP-4-dehydrorhamnose reductase [Vibrio variabilis]|uniref:dTDP-4-dehydrorhamnose reductase n=1 Tax=Vibrio variabilis TaxID=990271 RepID=A0ABR4YE50_9VIBR|nr:dTDP-4-dehydrorhamnose reductase [Vibrio variabilis]